MDMKKPYKLLLAFSSSSWVIAIYGIKEEWTFLCMPSWLFAIFLISAPLVLSSIALWLTRFFPNEEVDKCIECTDANPSFLSIYLGYFFIGLGIDKAQHLIFVYLVIFILTFVSQIVYFNPIFLIFRYRFYYVVTSDDTRIYVIAKKTIRNKEESSFQNLRRLDDSVFIEWSKKNELRRSQVERQESEGN